MELSPPASPRRRLKLSSPRAPPRAPSTPPQRRLHPAQGLTGLVTPRTWQRPAPVRPAPAKERPPSGPIFDAGSSQASYIDHGEADLTMEKDIAVVFVLKDFWDDGPTLRSRPLELGGRRRPPFEDPAEHDAGEGGRWSWGLPFAGGQAARQPDPPAAPRSPSPEPANMDIDGPSNAPQGDRNAADKRDVVLPPQLFEDPDRLAEFVLRKLHPGETPFPHISALAAKIGADALFPHFVHGAEAMFCPASCSEASHAEASCVAALAALQALAAGLDSEDLARMSIILLAQVKLPPFVRGRLLAEALNARSLLAKGRTDLLLDLVAPLRDACSERQRARFLADLVHELLGPSCREELQSRIWGTPKPPPPRGPPHAAGIVGAVEAPKERAEDAVGRDAVVQLLVLWRDFGNGYGELARVAAALASRDAATKDRTRAGEVLARMLVDVPGVAEGLLPALPCLQSAQAFADVLGAVLLHVSADAGTLDSEIYRHLISVDAQAGIELLSLLAAEPSLRSRAGEWIQKLVRNTSVRFDEVCMLWVAAVSDDGDEHVEDEEGDASCSPAATRAAVLGELLVPLGLVGKLHPKQVAAKILAAGPLGRGGFHAWGHLFRSLFPPDSSPESREEFAAEVARRLASQPPRAAAPGFLGGFFCDASSPPDTFVARVDVRACVAALGAASGRDWRTFAHLATGSVLCPGAPPPDAAPSARLEEFARAVFKEMCMRRGAEAPFGGAGMLEGAAKEACDAVWMEMLTRDLDGMAKDVGKSKR